MHAALPPTADDLGPVVPYVPGGPEHAFRVSDVGGRAMACTGLMRTGPWAVGMDGRPAHSSLGVLVDVALGGAAVALRPSAHWGVTIDLFMTFGASIPVAGQDLRVSATAAHHDAGSAVVTGAVLAEDGSTVAVATQRTRFVPGEPGDPVPVDAVRWRDDAGLLDLLGAVGARTDDGEAEIRLATDSRLANPGGTLHGGIQFALAAEAAALAVAPLRLTSMHIAFVRPGPVSGPVRVATSTTYRGRTAALVEVRCHRADGQVCSVATATCAALV